MNRLLSAVCAGMFGATLSLMAIAPSVAMPVAPTAAKANTAIEQVQYQNDEYRPRHKERRSDRWDRRDRRDHGRVYMNRRDRDHGWRASRDDRRVYRRHHNGHRYPMGAPRAEIIIGN
ncbi:hypothetical protein [Phyllobacterium myrsinacearum]|uniref:BA14K family protein n=1 Tax=Phyllobacterium myrsinacearum TaxID=28101 RepID=A0A839EHB4_9HYPH|nr:hypothetical protein [Phyllobacterium myrsinacearum]MBA8876856.1 hypothetical protein [Phyllobacterium myrsinacearum]